MKNIFTILCALVLFNSCGQSQIKTSATANDPSISTAQLPVLPLMDSAGLNAFIRKEKIGDSAARQLRRFYKGRNFQYAWFTANGIAEHTRRFWELHNAYITTFADSSQTYHHVHQYLDNLLRDKSKTPSANEMPLAELQLTLHFFVYANHAYGGKANPAIMQWHIPKKKLDDVALLNSFIARDGKNIEDWEPVNQFYKRLKKELVSYIAIQKTGGWKTIAFDKASTYKPGDSSSVIREIAERLQTVTGKKIAAMSSTYGNELLPYIKSAQKSFGLKEDGIITKELISELNVPVGERIKKMLINIERMRWLPYQPEGEFIAVNIPEFRLHLFDGEMKKFSIDIVVGQAAHNTVIFTDKLKYVVFSPYWNVPASIVRREILPAIHRNGNYLSKNNMERTGYADGLPVIRQKPGGANALGKVKFIFPNSYNIYFHDTPAKSLFTNESRAFSHGCMRLAEPLKLATYLVRNQPEWTTKKIADAMNASVEKWVTLKEEVSVYITYFTAWVDSDGLLNFRKDIYNHDREVARSLHE